MPDLNMERHNNCINTLAIIEYINRHYGNPEELLEGLEKEFHGLPDPLAFLQDPNNWISSDVLRKMYANARRISGDENVAYKIGFESVTYRKLGYISDILLRIWASPNQAFPRVKRINDKFNRNKDIEVIRLPGNHVLLRLRWFKHLNLNTDFCLMNQGVYSAVPTIWGLPPGKVVETQCQFKGGFYCEFDATWEEHSVFRGLKLFFTSKRRLAKEIVSEIERDKQLLENKYSEVETLNKRLQQRIDQLLSIQQASGAILTELDYGTLLPTILKLFIKEIGYNRGIIMLIDRESQTLRFVDGVGGDLTAKQTLMDYEVPLSRHKENILAHVAAKGQPVIAGDVSKLGLNPGNLILSQFSPKSIVLLPLKARGEVIGVLGADKNTDTPAQPTLDQEYLQGFANQMALAIENARMYTELKQGVLKTIQALAAALEAKDSYTRGHSERVAQYSVRLAEKVEMSETQVEKIRSMCLVHDIGKIGIDEHILNKTGKLLDNEFDHIRQHPNIGVNIIKPLNLTPEEIAIVKHHHERFDGRGYPDGLKDSAIPLEVRVATICDAFDAMTSDRPYRRSLPLEKAVKELEEGSGTQFDPDLTPIFTNMIKDGEIRDILVRKVTLRAV
ncbi:MAG: HD domain-containing protein [Deltaproteobacteria bacterium]|nr:HD domain-containing protein [Deltaproteobacteria bacterium]MBW2053356.1 HD domain-containing protein [Deltaproteobacteria bacterium]MBW2142044.1 HD domain-containing protein [Deltaproteobacteria bacterium]MBW2324384.1 HD domain-containing protein [Deltaproteobacteria bacterium]